MKEKVTKKEIKATITQIILSKKPGEHFSAHRISRQYFSSVTVGEWADIRRSEWNRVKVYTGETIRELKESGKIVFVKELKRAQGLNEKIYEVKKK